jgi:hypothetical protein
MTWGSTGLSRYEASLAYDGSSDSRTIAEAAPVTMATLPLKVTFTFDSCVDEVAERRCASAIDTRSFRLRVGVALHADLRQSHL